jgi:hypothetical protein
VAAVRNCASFIEVAPAESVQDSDSLLTAFIVSQTCVPATAQAWVRPDTSAPRVSFIRVVAPGFRGSGVVVKSRTCKGTTARERLGLAAVAAA